MSVQLALLKSGEDVIADIKEYRDSDDNLVSYLFKDPFTIKLKHLNYWLKMSQLQNMRLYIINGYHYLRILILL